MPSCWILTEGKAGMESQGLALAEALEFSQVIVKRIQLRFPWRYLAPELRLFKRFSLSSQGDPLEAPWPDVIITVGRRAVLPGLMIKEVSPKTCLICVQNPRIHTQYFDVVIPSEHDFLPLQPNVFPVLGSLHGINEKKLNQAREEFDHLLVPYSTPRIGVIIGGSSHSYKMTYTTFLSLWSQICELQKRYQASLLITTSRRTPQAIKDFLSQIKHDSIFFWDGLTPNPYLGILAYSDALLVTCDSVNMISEACATSVPVYLLPLPGSSRRFGHFHQTLIDRGRAKWLKETLDFKRKEPLRVMETVVDFVRSRLS